MLLTYANTNLISAFLSFALAIFVLFKSRPLTRDKTSFALMLISVAGWCFGIYKHALAGNYESAYMWSLNLHRFAFLIPLFYFVFVYYFLGSKDRIYRALIYINLSVCALLEYLSFVFPKTIIADVSAIAIFQYFPKAGSLYFIYVLQFALSIIIASIFLTAGIFRQKSKPLKQRYIHILISTLVGFPCAGSTIIPMYNLNAVPWGNFATSLFIVVLVYSIMKHELLDIKLIITRTAAYGASITSVLILGLATAYINNSFFPNYIPIQIISISIFAFVSIAIFEPIRKFIQTPLVEKWITNWYDSEQLLNNIAKALIPVSEREDAFKVIASCLKDTIKIKNICILLGQRDETAKPAKYVLLKGEPMGTQDETSIEMGADNHFIAALSDAIHYGNLDVGAKDSIKEYSQIKDKLYIPLLSTGVLEGIIILGPKKSEDPYNQKDYALFRSIIVQARAILDRILNYETIKKDFEANQKKLYETDRLLARSEKIASLARLIQEYNHEIKTPLAIIKGETEALTDKPRDAAFLEQHKNLVLQYIDKADDIVRTTLRLGEPKCEFR